MKNTLHCLVLLLFMATQAYAQHSFSGQVKDKGNKEPLTGVIIYVPDLRTGVTTDLDGKFLMKDLPARTFLVEVKLIGYVTYQQIIDFSINPSQDFYLEQAILETKGVVITGNAFSTDSRTTSYQVVAMEKRELMTSSAGNIVNTLSKVPGISAVSTGGAIAKPQIRGLGYNRVITLNEGIRQEGAQWGDEHGLEIDQFSADRVEILKGPASLFYGSDAMGGVINILEPLPASPGEYGGEFASIFSLNNKFNRSSLMLEGNANGFIWRARGSFKTAATYQTPEEYVYNSAFQEKDLSVMAGLNKKWGYAHVHYSHFATKIGMIEGERDSATGKFVDLNGLVVSDDVLKGRDILLPFQEIAHDKLSGIGNIILGAKQLRFVIGYQQNQRNEFLSGEENPDMSLRLRTLTYEVKFQAPLKGDLETVYGVSGMTQGNVNKGVEFLVPDYTLQDAGGFVYVKKNMDSFSVNGGLRFDYRGVEGKELITGSGIVPDTIFREFSADFSALTGSAGMAWLVNENANLKINAGRAFRSPNIAELGANGVHEGTFRYEIGNSQLSPETSWQFDAGFEYEKPYYSLMLSTYYNIIENYIYQRNTDSETIDVDGDIMPVYRYVQGNSHIRGFEAAIDIHPWDHIHFDNTFAFTRGTNQSNGTDLPLIPAFRENHELRWNFHVKKDSRIRNPYMYVAFTYIWKQTHYDEFETETSDYGLWKAGMGTDIMVAGQLMHFFIEGENLFDKGYYDHLSRLKYVGIHEMGRNVSFGLSLPFGF